MNHSTLIMTPQVALRLVDRLSRLRSVSRFDQPGEPQAATLVHSLTDLEQSFREILDVLLPRLVDESLSQDQLTNVLLDVREELRHVLYHIKDPKFFSYLLED